MIHKFSQPHQDGKAVLDHLRDAINDIRYTLGRSPTYVTIDSDSYRKLVDHIKKSDPNYKNMRVLRQFMGVGVVVIEPVRQFYPKSCNEIPANNFQMLNKPEPNEPNELKLPWFWSLCLRYLHWIGRKAASMERNILRNKHNN